MKKSIPFILLITVVLLNSCDFLSSLTEFDLPYETSVTIPMTLATETPLDIATPAINTGIEAAVEKYDTGMDLIDEITLSSLTLTVTAPDSGDFGFLSSIEIFIAADSLDEVQLAFDTAVDDNATADLELETSTQDLQDYIKSNSFSLRFRVISDETVLEEQEILMNAVFRVDAQILGL